MRWPWQRRRELRRQLVMALVVAVVLSVVLVGGLNFIAARRLLQEGIEEQLADVGEARSQSIELGANRLLGVMSTAAADLAVVDALVDLNEGFDAIDDDALDAEQLEALQDDAERVVSDYAALGRGDFPASAVVPDTAAGRYLQSRYVFADDDDPELGDPAPPLEYDIAYNRHAPFLESLAERLGMEDLLLVSADTLEVVYSTQSRVDLGHDLAVGSLSESALAVMVRDQLPRLPIGETAVADYQIYAPADGEPVLFASTAVRRGSQVVGAIVAQVSDAALTEITTAGGDWDAVGLGPGESYVVGLDQILRSQSREWIEDPEGFLADVDDDELAARIAAFDTPVAIMPVDTDPVATAFDGEVFQGRANNYLGQSTFSYARMLDISAVDWVVVADVPLSTARRPLYDYGVRLGIVVLVILPVAMIAGTLLARRITRQIPPVVDAALAVAEGERDPDLPELGNDELGDLARRLRDMAHELERQETAVEEEYDRRRDLLLAVLPRRMVGPRGELDEVPHTVDEGTVVSVDVVVRDTTVDDEAVGDFLAAAAQLADDLAIAHSIDRIRADASLYLFAAGLDHDTAEADVGLAFAVELVEAVAGLAASEAMDCGVRIGVASGVVVGAVQHEGALMFGAWGEPVHRAVAISAMATNDEIVVDETTVDALESSQWALETVGDAASGEGRLHRLHPEPLSPER